MDLPLVIEANITESWLKHLWLQHMGLQIWLYMDIPDFQPSQTSNIEIMRLCLQHGAPTNKQQTLNRCQMYLLAIWL